MAQHDCTSSDFTVCLDGTLYGPCEHPCCNGDCTDVGPCECECHLESSTN